MSRKLLKNNEIVSDDSIYWSPVSEISNTTGEVLIPVKYLADYQQSGVNISNRVILLLSPDSELTTIALELKYFDAIAIEFPSFMDGRGYSIARNIRDELKYQGELRAVGDVLVDQLFMLSRCGFDSFSLQESQNTEAAIKALNTFTVRYQGASDSKEALHLRR